MTETRLQEYYGSIDLRRSIVCKRPAGASKANKTAVEARDLGHQAEMIAIHARCGHANPARLVVVRHPARAIMRLPKASRLQEPHNQKRKQTPLEFKRLTQA